MTPKQVKCRILALTLLEKETGVRVEVRLRAEDQKLITRLLKKDFRIKGTKEVKE